MEVSSIPIKIEINRNTDTGRGKVVFWVRWISISPGFRKVKYTVRRVKKTKEMISRKDTWRQSLLNSFVKTVYPILSLRGGIWSAGRSGKVDLKGFELIRSVMSVVFLILLYFIQAGNTMLGKRDQLQPGFGNGFLA